MNMGSSTGARLLTARSNRGRHHCLSFRARQQDAVRRLAFRNQKTYARRRSRLTTGMNLTFALVSPVDTYIADCCECVPLECISQEPSYPASLLLSLFPIKFYSSLTMTIIITFDIERIVIIISCRRRRRV